MLRLHFLNENNEADAVDVSFMYTRARKADANDVMDGLAEKIGDDVVRDTLCTLLKPGTDDVISQGTACQHRNDKFVRSMGRKLAFGRAVQGFTNNYRVRCDLWKQFLKQVKVG